MPLWKTEFLCELQPEAIAERLPGEQFLEDCPFIWCQSRLSSRMKKTFPSFEEGAQALYSSTSAEENTVLLNFCHAFVPLGITVLWMHKLCDNSVFFHLLKR